MFGVLEVYWNGDPLQTVEEAMRMAAGMTYNGIHPQVSLHEGGTKGTRVAAKPMRIIEKALVRMKGLKKWFVKITPRRAQAAVKKLEELAA